MSAVRNLQLSMQVLQHRNLCASGTIAVWLCLLLACAPLVPVHGQAFLQESLPLKPLAATPVELLEGGSAVTLTGRQAITVCCGQSRAVHGVQCCVIIIYSVRTGCRYNLHATTMQCNRAAALEPYASCAQRLPTSSAAAAWADLG